MTDVELVKAKPELCRALALGDRDCIKGFLANRSFTYEQNEELKTYVAAARAAANLALDQKAADLLLEGKNSSAQTISSPYLLMPDGSPIPSQPKACPIDEDEFLNLFTRAGLLDAVAANDSRKIHQLLVGRVFSQEQIEFLHGMKHKPYAKDSPQALELLSRAEAGRPFPDLEIQTDQAPIQTPPAVDTLTELLKSSITSAVARADMDDLKLLLKGHVFTTEEVHELGRIAVNYQDISAKEADLLLSLKPDMVCLPTWHT